MIDENVTIYIPNDYDQEVDISTVSRDLTITDDVVFKLRTR